MTNQPGTVKGWPTGFQQPQSRSFGAGFWKWQCPGLAHPQGHLVLLQAAHCSGQPTIHLLSCVWWGLSWFPWEQAAAWYCYKKHPIILKLTEVLCSKERNFSMHFPAHSVTTPSQTSQVLEPNPRNKCGTASPRQGWVRGGGSRARALPGSESSWQVRVRSV